MSEYNYNESTYGVSGVNAYITKVFTKMGLGLLVTALVAFITEYFGLYYRYYMMTGGIGTILLVFVQFGLCISMGRNLTDRDTRTTNLLFMCYAAVTGFTFSTLVYVYTTASVFNRYSCRSICLHICSVLQYGNYRSYDQCGYFQILRTSDGRSDCTADYYSGIHVHPCITFFPVDQLPWYYCFPWPDSMGYAENQADLLSDRRIWNGC